MRCGIFHWKVGEKKLAINQTQHQLLKTFAQALYEYLLRVPQPGLLASSSEESDGYVYETSGLIVCRGSVTPPRAGGGMVPPSALHGDLNVPSLHDP